MYTNIHTYTYMHIYDNKARARKLAGPQFGTSLMGTITITITTTITITITITITLIIRGGR